MLNFGALPPEVNSAKMYAGRIGIVVGGRSRMECHIR